MNAYALKPLLRVDFVPAQRGLGQEEADGRPGSDPHRIGLFSSQVLKFARQNLNSDTPTPGHHPDLIKAVTNAQNDLDTQIRAALAPTIKDVEKLGYPGLHDPQQIDFRTRIHTSDLLNHNTAVQYRMDGQEGNTYFPEHTIGLGYQNLQSLSYQLVSFRETRLNPSEGAPAAVHLVLLEEPEAHLHVQVQRIFPKKALELITPSDSNHAHLANQLILSTHASHLAHSDSFTRLRYVRRASSESPESMPYSEVINLADVFGDDFKTLAFAERYFHVQHTDLLFADAAIFVEGTAERMLVPFFIDGEFEELSRRYLSFLDIGGSHAHRLKPLVERLGIPTVIITDIDPVEVTKSKANRTVRKATVIRSPKNLECGNDTLTKWHPRKICLDDFGALSGEDLTWVSENGTRVRFAWQLPIFSNGPWPSSFEDSFILSNLDWFKRQMDETGPLGKACEVARECEGPNELNEALHEMLHGSFKKGDFASTIFEKLSIGEPLTCPSYISDALGWLQRELDPKKGGG
ncbi:hypothetical protein J057_24310 [Marinobacter nanhaiticus D15-8W]|uniref:Uncharacterized protein n=1 Tax=Marinobacter nanhaiticus D15-8W TaxID=626887 RepID=A0A371CGC3_9GAMM|nr:AAA family ATPase [Marinobacter nanhaiticus]RDW95449.1 hypothetical protein J057_24310 [Marinobacter nanhaiticus D15-8W]